MGNDVYKYNFYVGLRNSNNDDAPYVNTEYFETDMEANFYAFDLAIEEYQRYEGLHGLLTWDDCYAELLAQNLEEPTEEEVNEMYYEEVENHITFFGVRIYE